MRGRREHSCARRRRVYRLALAALVLIGLLEAMPARAASVMIVRPANSPPVMVETLVRLRAS